MAMGGKRRSEDLPQDGLQIPCLLKFKCPDEIVDKVKKWFGKMEGRPTSIANITCDLDRDCAQWIRQRCSKCGPSSKLGLLESAERSRLTLYHRGT